MLFMSKKKSETQQITMRMSMELLDRLERISDAMFGVKRSQLIHRAVEEFVLRHEQQLSQQQGKHPPRG
jgi:metal-responsive CopG/Arc/MetJ family transcriptional regulator